MSSVHKLFGGIPNDSNAEYMERNSPANISNDPRNSQTISNSNQMNKSNRSFTGVSSGVNAPEKVMEEHNRLLRLIFDLETERDSQHTRKSSASLVNLRSGSVISNPDYIKTALNGEKRNPLIAKLRLLQSFHFHQGPIWVMKFSFDGLFLCTAGKDKQVVIWQVGTVNNVSSPATQTTDFEDNMSGNSPVQNALNSSMSQNFDRKLATLNRRTSTSQLFDRLNTNTQSDLDSDHLNQIELELDGNNSALSSPKRHFTGGHSFHYTHTNNNINDFIQKKPYRIFMGHENDVIDVSWSKSQFLLSASIDKTVRLWHITKADCLLKFNHPDIITSVEFHPEQDRFFITGCFDKKIRVWDMIPEPSVREYAQATDIVTAVRFSPDGKLVASGLINGQVYFYDYEGMKYVTQMNCRNRSGKYSGGSKVTSLEFYSCEHNTGSLNATSSQGNPHTNVVKRKYSTNLSDHQLLVTTNDSSVRLFSTVDYSLEQKFKGLKNTRMQIKASFSEDRKYIICGSEDGKVFVWNAKKIGKHYSFFNILSSSHAAKKNYNYECFDNIVAATNTITNRTSNANSSSAQSAVATPTNAPTINAVFTPSRCIENIISSHPQLTDHTDIIFGLDFSDLCTRIILTSDTDGNMSIYIRGV